MGKSKNKRADHDRSKKAIILFVVCLAATVLYRFIIIADYASKYVDDDQAMIWYETVEAAHFQVREPHFYGQAYGSILEALVGAPLYMIGLPLNVAASLATFIVWFLPFLFCALKLLKKKPFMASAIMVLPLLFTWRYDVLTSARSFISGFSLAVAGIILLQGSKGWQRFLAPVLMMLGFITTETSITVSALGVLYYILYDHKSIKKDWKFFLAALPVCGGLYYYCNILFYKLNPDHNLHGGVSSLSFSLETLLANIPRVPKLTGTFSILSFEKFPIVLLAIIICLFVIGWKKDKRLFIIQLCAVLGGMAFLALPKSADYTEELLFSQSRMFLYIPYVLVVVMMFFSEQTELDFLKEQKGKETILATVCIIIAVTKLLYFEGKVLDEPELYNCSIVSVWSTDNIKMAATEFLNIKQQSNCDEMIFLNGAKSMIYGSSALNYGKYTSYIASYDRRTDIYLKLKNEIVDKDVVFVYIDSQGYINSNVERVQGESIVDYIRHQYGMQRYLPSDARYIND